VNAVLLAGFLLAPPERPPVVEGECPQAFALPAGYAPPEGLIDPATGKSVCGGVLLPTSLTAYYIELDSWKDLAVVEMETLENKQPTFWEKWGDRVQWTAVGVAVGVAVTAVSLAPP
jgi:hypothetical protein